MIIKRKIVCLLTFWKEFNFSVCRKNLINKRNILISSQKKGGKIPEDRKETVKNVFVD